MALGQRSHQALITSGSIVAWSAGFSLRPAGSAREDFPCASSEFEGAIQKLGLPRLPARERRANDGGRHLYYQRPAGTLTGTRLPEGIDLKVKGYCIVPPSVHPATNLPYRWDERPEAPDRNRNKILYWAECRVAEAGYPPEAWDALAAAARTAGLPDHEIRRAIRSAQQTGGAA